MKRRIALLAGLIFLVLTAGAIAWILSLDKTVTSRFEGKRWQVPARVYARPLELYSGRILRMEDVTDSLTRLGYHQSAGAPASPGFFHKQGDTLLVYTRSFDFGDNREPALSLRIEFAGGRVLRVGRRNGGVIRRVRLEPEEIGAFYPKLQQDRILVKLKEVPKALISAIIATEDRRFYEHHGVDPRGILRALFRNAQVGHTVEGGSTLTQQLVKNLYLSNERTLWRKIREAIMAMLLEFHYSKNEILEAYLNEIYLGQDGSRSIHGVGLASRIYFGVNVSQLNLRQAALLAGMIQAPNLYNPRRNPTLAIKRRNEVLDRMVAAGFLDKARAARDQAAPLGLMKVTHPLGPNPAFLDLVRRQLRQDYDEKALTADGLRIFTTLDIPSQRALEKSLIQTLPKLEQQRRFRPDTLQGAGVIVQPGTGEVLALVGDREPGYAGFNRALDAVRQVGSLIKPAIYLTALSRSSQYTLASVLNDSPFTWRVNNQEWRPENYDRQFRGPVLLEKALAESLNVPTVRLGQSLGLPSILTTVQQLGINRDLPDLPSTLLGAAGLTPIEVAQMYQVIANGGYRAPLRSIRAVYTADGKPLRRYPTQTERVADPKAVYLLDYALQQVLRWGTGAAAARYVPVGPGLAGKTGTTNDLRDSWFAGFSPDWLGVVWVGRDDNKPAGFSGAQGALRVWGDMARSLHVHPVPFARPAGIQTAYVDPKTGLQPGANCMNAGSEPTAAAVSGAPGLDDPFMAPPPVARPVRNYVELPFVDGSVPRPGDPCQVEQIQPVPGSEQGEPGYGNQQAPVAPPPPGRDPVGNAINSLFDRLGSIFH